MSDPSASNRWPPFAPSWMGYLIALQMLFGLPPLVLPLTPWQVLPSSAWADEALPLALATGLAYAIFMAWALWSHRFFGRQVTDPSRSAIKVIFASVIWFLFGYLSVLVSVPMVDAAMFGHYSQPAFVVSGLRLTRWPPLTWGARIQGLPLFANELHHLPDDLLAQLKPGTRIVISGRGTVRGVLVDYVRIAESGR